jgi:D-sedoheptulose 7-phosphate isomerase
MADQELVRRAFSAREQRVRAYFGAHGGRLAEACHRMAERFARGGRILAFGCGAAATDAQHISVEFVHPVIVGKRALPAIALPNDGPSLLSSLLADPTALFTRHLQLIGKPEDIAVGFTFTTGDHADLSVRAALKEAEAQGMLALAFTGGAADLDAHHIFPCDDPDPFVVQEVHETAYHMLWELVHVFFEHRGLLSGRRQEMHHDVGASSFLYPFLDEQEKDLDAVLEEVAGSIAKKADDIIEIRAASAARDAERFLTAAAAVRERLEDGGKVLAFGNGGSATDAQDLVTDLIAPPAGLRPQPALSLTNEEAVVTAVGNDVGYDNVFARQVIAYGETPDIAVGISTSGNSRNVLAALEEARRRGLLCIGLAGYGGGRMVESGVCDHAFVIDHEYIPRIQEAQATQYHLLRRLIDEP